MKVSLRLKDEDHECYESFKDVIYEVHQELQDSKQFCEELGLEVSSERKLDQIKDFHTKNRIITLIIVIKKVLIMQLNQQMQLIQIEWIVLVVVVITKQVNVS
jgi:O-succinylbenzoate synthase